MTLTRVTVFIYAYRLRKARLMTQDAPKSLRAASRVDRRCRPVRKFPAVALCAVVLSTVSIGLGEDVDRIPRVTLNPTAALSSDSATTYPQLRAAMSYEIAVSPHVGANQLDRDIQNAQRRVREAPAAPILGATGFLHRAAGHDDVRSILRRRCIA
jgi:hypothetical protein